MITYIVMWYTYLILKFESEKKWYEVGAAVLLQANA